MMKTKTVPDSDDRVRCWTCAERRRSESVPVPLHDLTGKPTTVYIERKICIHGLGYDPVILRRCTAYRPLPAQYCERLPAR